MAGLGRVGGRAPPGPSPAPGAAALRRHPLPASRGRLRGRFRLLAAGGDHSVARLNDGSVVAWGNNSSGQCNVPALSPGLVYDEIAAGGVSGFAGTAHSLARISDGSVRAWGDDTYGQCNVPTWTPGLRCVEVKAGGYPSPARLSDGSGVACGWNLYGQCRVASL